MDRLGPSLEHILEDVEKFSFKTINEIGIQLVEIMRQFHKTGWIYNDLKPDNICIGNPRNAGESKIVKLIDFGLCTRYMVNDAHIAL